MTHAPHAHSGAEVNSNVLHAASLPASYPSSSQHLRRAKYRAEGMLHFFTIGNSHIKTIEGRFGSSVASFFTFLRWICALNLGLALTVVGFLMVPQVRLNTYRQTHTQTHKRRKPSWQTSYVYGQWLSNVCTQLKQHRLRVF